MAASTCPKCENTSFELKEAVPRTSVFKLMFVQCSACGAVVGVMDYDNIGARLAKQDQAIKAIAEKISVYVDL